ncbi:Hypothetical predicted protein [Mytilus galloprovincialis]|uniref:Uncharacterized protein n=1 Tax=Mytilus galloprovincialis TaxID=29158 RepID=A0A8B6G7B4_MYTGA|nr:Hypothetical predicted protein [Mytilus galloprovincialis]
MTDDLVKPVKNVMDVTGNLLGFIFNVLTILSTKILELYGEVECTIGSKPAIFGQPLSILCTNTNPIICVKNESRVWMGGENLDLLVLEGIQMRRAGRYSEKVQSCSEFELLISNLSESDLDHNYGCTVGFSDCRLKLSLTEGDFEYHPEELDIHKNFSISVHDLFVSVNISKVYPVPTCSVLFGIQKLDEFINQSATRIGNFFSTYFDLQFKLPQDQCPLKINISCLVGSTLIPILTSEIANCSSNALPERSLLQRRRPILAVILTLGSIYLAGHTEYISFKQFLQDTKRFVKKVKREKKHKDNPAEKRRLNEISVADQSTDECHQSTKDTICNQS